MHPSREGPRAGARGRHATEELVPKGATDKRRLGAAAKRLAPVRQGLADTSGEAASSDPAGHQPAGVGPSATPAAPPTPASPPGSCAQK